MDTMVDFTAGFYLKLQLKPPYFTRKYGVMQSYMAGDVIHTLKYNVSVAYLKTIGNVRLFSVERSTEVYVNDIEPDLIAEELACECGKIFYPLVVEADFSGAYIQVHNYAEIVSRWNTQKINIQEYFKGMVAERYMDLMEEAISSAELVTELFRNELFCSTFFSSFYKSYSPVFKLEEVCFFPIAGKASPVRFNTVQQVNPVLNEAGKIEIIQHGEMADERTVRDLANEQDFALSKYMYPDELPAKGKYTNIIRLDAETKAIFSIVADWTVSADPVQKTEIKIFELLEKAEEAVVDSSLSEPSGMVFLDGLQHKKDNKFINLFDFLIGK